MKDESPKQLHVNEGYDSAHEFFEVQGAGYVALRNTGISMTGSAHGISFDVSWSRFGYSGGVMDVSEIRRLVSALSDWPEKNGDEAEQRKRPDEGSRPRPERR